MHRQKNKKLTQQQIIEMLISPRAALDRLIATGRIDYNDVGSLQCCYVLAIQIDKFSGVECPDTSIIEKLCQDIDNGEISEEDVESAASWLHQYQLYLGKVSIDSVRKAIFATQKMVTE